MRGRAGKGKISLEYFGIHGHKQGKSFSGFLPPQSNVRVYHLVWKNGEGNYDLSQAASDPALNDSSMAYNHTTADMNFEPIPTQRNISPEYASCVVAIFRGIIGDYKECNYGEKNLIWNRALSAVKYSLTQTVQIAEDKRRRRRPLKESLESTTWPQQEIDKRAIKKAIRLVLEGAVSKATKVLDRKIKPNTLSDEEIFSQLKILHPDGPITFHLPHDAPKIACITTEELRSAGRR